ncbi:hypothetical protein Turpa_1242 [Turneriella parva DSM 21527]|uniref:Uncharacterized protein n=1 Tax=Turneriella parva (strain ATCC BAA-1111 / DSM 21527 / NCTC 11395 / H) TaxID=869212 RepID=I4B3N3_TURPD|nr:hypothetical protein Turpa_1242 [Turneriella parva DSM 21527]
MYGIICHKHTKTVVGVIQCGNHGKTVETPFTGVSLN